MVACSPTKFCCMANCACRTCSRMVFSVCCKLICAWRYSSTERTWSDCAMRLRKLMLTFTPTPLSGALLLKRFWKESPYPVVGMVPGGGQELLVQIGFCGPESAEAP